MLPEGLGAVVATRSVGEKYKYHSHLWMFSADGTRQLTVGDVADSQPRVRPTGDGVAFVSNRAKPGKQIFWLPFDGGEPRPITSLPEGEIGEFRWSPLGNEIAFLFRKTLDERTEDAKKKREESGESAPPWIVEDLTWRYDGDGIFGAARYQVWVADFETGVARPVFCEAKKGEYQFAWSPDGKQLAIAFNPKERPTMEPFGETIVRVELESGRVVRTDSLPVVNFSKLAWSPNGEWIATLYEDRETDRFGYKNNCLALVGARDFEFRSITGKLDIDFACSMLSDLRESGASPELFWTSDSNQILLSVAQRGGSHLARLDLRASGFGPAEPEFLTEGMEEFTLCACSSDGRTAVCAVSRPDGLPEFRLVEVLDSGVRPAAETGFNDALASEIEVLPLDEHWVESEPGVQVHTWVIRPKFAEGERRPCVLEVHGGPHGMYTRAFFFEMQLLAANGYVVVFSNPRGSTGYGESFARCIDGDWGVKDWRDVQAIADFASTLDFVDAERLAIMGGSYGGYMVNWAISHTNRYKCAITDRCVSNLLSKSGNSDYTFVPDGVWPGAAYGDYEILWDRSPVKHFANVETPTMVIHSEGDLRCNVEQGEQVFAFLQMRGIPSRFVRYPSNTSHGMSRAGPPDLRIDRLRRILSWYSERL